MLYLFITRNLIIQSHIIIINLMLMPTNLLTMDMDQVHIPDTGMIHMNFFILKIF